MNTIKVEHNPTRTHLEELGVFNWPLWTKEVSEFPWSYDATETCYFLAGDITVIPEGGAPVSMSKGDLVTFPSGVSCKWIIRKAVAKHYRFF